MTRLLLADDLSLYEDGEVPAPPPQVQLPASSELPYHDARHVARVLTVTADGTLAWTYNPVMPVANGTDAGSVLYIGEDGQPLWAPLNQAVDHEVLETDDDGLAQVVIGPDAGHDTAAVDGSLWLVCRLVQPAPPPPAAPDVAPVLTVT